MKDLIFLAVLGLVCVAGLAWALARAVRFRRIARCHHLDRQRFWLPKHCFIAKCKACGLIVERGRDVTHVYPDDVRPTRHGKKAGEKAIRANRNRRAFGVGP